MIDPSRFDVCHTAMGCRDEGERLAERGKRKISVFPCKLSRFGANDLAVLAGSGTFTTI